MYDDTPDERPWTSGLPWALVGLLAGLLAGALLWTDTSQTPGWTTYAGVYESAAPSVVNVSVSGDGIGVGSGFAVSGDKVITARHLVEGADAIVVRGLDGVEYQAAPLGMDARTDLALLDVPGATFQPARLGRSRSLAVGDTVLAIGNPYGLGHSLAQGVVGGAQRAIDGAEGGAAFVQLSIPLNPGNSGGPVLDERGLVVGVLAGTHTQGQAIAFAVPVDVLTAALPALLRGDRLTRAWMGLRGDAVAQGLSVRSVIPGGPADRAGVRVGDVVTEVEGHEANTPEHYERALDLIAPGAKVDVRIIRDGERLSIPVLAVDRAARTVVASGMTLRAAAGTGGEVVAVRPDSRADRAGVREGDVLRAVSGFVVQSPADVQDLLAGQEAVRVEVVRDGTVLRMSLAAL